MSDINDYCKNPKDNKYINLSSTTREYYNSICILQSGVIEKSIKDIVWKTDIIGMNMIMGIFSPEGLAMLSVYKGVELVSEATFDFLIKSLASNISENILNEASLIALEQGAEFANSAIILSVCAKSVEYASLQAISVGALRVLSTAAEYVTIILIIVQLVSMIIDGFDPEGYNNEMDASMLDIMSENLNNSFSKWYYENMSIGNDEFGNIINGNGEWPIERYADSYLDSYLDNLDIKVDYDSNIFKYMCEYLLELKVNSNGQPISWGTSNKTTLLDQSDFRKYTDQYFMILGGKNNIFANWLNKNWIIIIVIIILIIFFLFVIK